MQDFNKDVKKIGLGGMNTSIVDTLLPANMVRTIRNGHIFDSNDNRDGTARNVLGNVNVSYREEDFGDGAEVIGSCRNEQDNTIIFFVAAGPGYRDSIMEYSPDLGTVVSVLNSTDNFWLYFSKDYRIKGAFVIDGLLYWNDANNGLRMTNLAKAKLWAKGDRINGYSVMDEQTISLIKYPPTAPVNPFYRTNESEGINNLKGKVFQFCYSYVYDNDEESTMSPFSKIALPIGDIDIYGNEINSPRTNNYINFSYNVGHSTVDLIKIYVREGNTGNWFLYDTIIKSDLLLDDDEVSFGSAGYAFYNNKTLIGADQTRVNTASHSVPFKADILSYLHTNNLLIGGLDEGFANIKTDVVLDFRLNEVSTAVPGDQLHSYSGDDYFWGNEIYNPEAFINYQFFAMKLTIYNGQFTAGNILGVYIEGSGYVYIPITVNMQDDFFELKAAIIAVINTNFGTNHRAYQIGEPGPYAPDSTGFFDITYTVAANQIVVARLNDGSHYHGEYYDISLHEYESVAGGFETFTGFKTGASHPFGIVYSDAQGRNSFVQDCGEVYIPFPTENEWPENELNFSTSIRYQIKHTPPLWAARYKWVYAKNTSILSFRQFVIDGMTEHDSEDEDSPNLGKVGVNITTLNTLKIQNNDAGFSFLNSSITPYIWQKGDRIRFITLAVDIENFSELGSVLDEYIDMEILEYQILPPDTADPPDLDKVTATNTLLVQSFNFTGRNLGAGTLVEIYTPKDEFEEKLYYETPFEGTIINPYTDERAHEGNEINQTTDEPDPDDNLAAIGTINSGDAYWTPTVFNVNETTAKYFVFSIESQSASNIYDQKDYSLGRPNIINKKAERKKNLNLRLSGKYFEGTEINGLSEFYGGADLYVSAEFGDTITGLREVGFTLKALQERKVTSFFVGRTGLQLASGAATDEIMANSDAALSTKSPSQESRGTTNPESVLVVDRHLYFVDVNNGAIVRDAANGMFDIDPYGIQKDIKYICNLLRTEYTSSRVLTSYNPVNNQVGFSFVGFNKNGSRDFGTYYFKNDKNQWTCIFDYYDAAGSSINEFASINQNYISFVGTKIWLHDKNPLKNNFYGSQLPFVIEMIFNKANGLPKLYKTIEIIGKGEWSCPEYGDVKIESKNAVIAKEQTSRLVKGKFKNIKGKQIAVLLKDSNTQNGSNQTKNLMNGNDLKGSVLFIRLVNTESTEAIIDSVATLYQVLKLS